MLMTRRTALVRSMLAGAALLPPRARSSVRENARERLRELEAKHGGRLGVAILDVASSRRLDHRADERFAMCSTFKFLAVALVLARVDRGEEQLDRRIAFTRRDLVAHSPATESRVGPRGMTVSELCAAAMTISDNTAGNLLLASFGGPAALTSYARSLGDTVTRLDRVEVDLNEATPGDLRDTTTPSAMLHNLRRVVLGDALSARSREHLIGWMVANRTGNARLRAGFPPRWRVGDKTGSGSHATTNDIAIAWPSNGAPLIVSAYYAESSASSGERNAVLAEVGRIAAAQEAPRHLGGDGAVDRPEMMRRVGAPGPPRL